MIRWSITFFLMTVAAGVLGFGKIAGPAAGIARDLFYLFLALLVLSIMAQGGRPTKRTA